jgi:hypothetical protein
MLFILPIPCVYCCCCCCCVECDAAAAAELWAEGAVEVIGVSEGVPLLVVLCEDSVLLSLESFFADWRRLFFSAFAEEKDEVFFLVFWSVFAEASAPVGEEGASFDEIECVFFIFSSHPNVGMRWTQENFFFPQTANKSGKKKEKVKKKVRRTDKSIEG